jgi:transaldolase
LILKRIPGITTNPVLLQRAGVPCTLPSVTQLARAALDDRGVGEFMLQAWGGDAASLVSTGAAIASLDSGLNRVVVKLPLTRDGVAAARVLGKDGARICMTACYNQQQAFVACGLGAEYVAPYLGRMSDSGKDGVAECAAMAALIKGMGGSTRVLVASLRSASQLPALAALGCNTFTYSPAIAAELLREPLTDAAAADFEAAAMGGG